MKSTNEEDWIQNPTSKLSDDFTFPKVTFHFISSNIPASPAYGVYISKLIRYSRVCAQYSDVLDIYQLLTQKLLNKGTLLLSWNPSTRSDWPLRKMHISNNSESFTFCIDCWVHHWIFGGVRVAQHLFDLLPKLSVSLEFAPIISSGVHLVYFVLIFLVPCCDVCYDFRMQTPFGSSLPPVVWRRAHVWYVLSFVFTFLVQCCGDRYDFHIKTIFGSFLPPTSCL